MDKISLSKAFSNHFIEFLDEMTKLFPKNVEIRTFKTAVNQIKRINPSKLIKTWHSVVTEPFKNEIYNGDFNFFEDKDYSSDFKNTMYDYEGMYKFIDEMKRTCRTLSDVNKNKTMKYLSNLTKMSEMYHNK